jgi:protein O-GlcNAc transferase
MSNYEEEIDILLDNNISFNIKEELLYKLITLNPTDYILYYYMATIQHQFNKKLVWYRICYLMNPNYIENILDYIKLLFDNNYIDDITKFNIDNNNILEKIDDPRFELLMATYELKRGNNQQTINILNKLIQKNISKHLLTLCYANLGVAYHFSQKIDIAIYYMSQAIELNPHLVTSEIYSNLFLIINYFYFYSYDKYLKYNKVHGGNADKPMRTLIKNDKIKIGYVSGDFNIHVTSHNILPILQNHNLEIFDVYCFSNNDYDVNLYSKFKMFDIRNMDKYKLAQYICSFEIDILIDLSGHINLNRLDVFTLRPAPIQMTYIGYPNTTGLTAIQYRITDAIADHPETTQQYTENLIRLPGCFLLFEALYNKNQIKDTIKDNIILGALNKPIKNSEETLDTWKQILELCPNTKLLIRIDDFDYYQNKLNVDFDRLLPITFIKDEEAFYKLYSQIDILLDTFPYSGTITTCKSLYNSVPVVTLYNKNIHAHNVSASILIHSGFPELVAYSNKEYIQIVKSLVENPEKIDDYKKNISAKFEKLMDPKPFMIHYEKMLSDLYDKHLGN